MSALDPRSLVFVASLLGLMCSVILFMLRRSFPPTIGGLVHWSRGLFGMVIASTLFGLTGLVPVFFSVILGNAMLVAGIMSFYAGFRHFAGMPPQTRLLLVVLALLTSYVAWFTYVDNRYQARALLVTFTDTVLFFECMRLVYATSGKTLAGRFTCIVFATIGAFSAVRAIMLLFHVDAATDLLEPTMAQKAYLAAMAFSVLAITLGAMMMANEKLRSTLEFIASHDQLTGAFARSAFLELLTKELARARRTGRLPALLMFDLDNFKSINDRFGHVVGDHVIVDFARRARELLRGPDSLGRYGGEEFIALLPETTLEEAKAVAERICGRIAAATSTDLPPYTVSVGVSSVTAVSTDVDSLLSKADQALYRAKANGRNRVEVTDAEPPTAMRLFS